MSQTDLSTKNVSQPRITCQKPSQNSSFNQISIDFNEETTFQGNLNDQNKIKDYKLFSNFRSEYANKVMELLGF